jgi:hypothetical protein
MTELSEGAEKEGEYPEMPQQPPYFTEPLRESS